MDGNATVRVIASDQNILQFNLSSPIFDTEFSSRRIAEVGAAKNLNGSVDFFFRFGADGQKDLNIYCESGASMTACADGPPYEVGDSPYSPIKINLDKAKNKMEFFDGKTSVEKLAGDSFYMANFIGDSEGEIFRALLNEVDFQQMFQFSPAQKKIVPIPRLVAAQTSRSSDGSGIYRMPGCNEGNIRTSEWTDTVQYVRNEASKTIGQELNHCVITLFRDENDALFYHTDKLLDLEENSLILSISFGAPRPIIFKSLETKHKQMVVLQPGSLLAIGPETNKKYKHCIPGLAHKVPPRISLSLRTIGSFVRTRDDGSLEITGKGADYQTENYPFIESHGGKYDGETQKRIDSTTKMKMAELEETRRSFG